MHRERRCQLAALRYGDHVCLLYEDPDDQLRSVVHFARHGIQAGDRCVLIVDEAQVARLLEAFELSGIDAGREQRRGALRLLGPHETYLRSRTFDPRAMVAWLQAMIEQATGDGFAGFRIAGEASWALSAASIDEVNAYECLLNDLFPGQRAIGLCQYHRRPEQSGTLYGGLRNHPWTALRGHVIANPFYEPPRSEGGPEQGLDQQVQWMIGRIEAEESQMAEAMETDELYRSLIAAIPAAMYTTDVEGRITLYNEQAVEMWGRRPEVGKEFWCGSFRIFHPGGPPMPHDQCPMAVTLREGRPVRGEVIEVERPDGVRSTILPHPVPLRNTRGEMVGALNMLVDISERKRAEEMQQLLATVVENSEDAIISLTLDGRILSWNAGAERLFEYGADEVIGQPVSLMVPPDRQGEEREILARLQRGERVQHYDTIRLSKGGRPIDISLSVSPIRDGTGRIVGASKVARDITARRQAEQERLRLLAAEQQARSEAESSRRSYLDLVNGLEAIVWEAGPPWRKFHFVSQRAEQILGYPVQRWIEEPDFWERIIHPDDRRRAVQVCQEAIARCADHDLEYRVLSADGQVLWLRDLVYIVPNGSGQAVWLRGVMVDVTRTKQLETDLQKRADELAESDRRKDEFLALLGHELRNPLAPIRTGLDILTASGIDHEVVPIMCSQVDCLVRLVDDLLDVSRISRGKIRLHKEAVDLASVLRQEVEATAALAAQRGHEVRVTAPAPVWVLGDSVRLAQVVTNLLHNAIKYTDPGGTIVLTATAQDGLATLTVRDNGIGIEPDGLTRIFEPFSQCERARENFQGGLGIGLTLVQSLVAMHGGQVDAFSEGPGKGSEFRVTIPLLDRAAPRASSGPPAPHHRAFRRILIVDDNVSAARTLEMLLARLGTYDVHVAHDGPTALELLLELSPDVALVDLDLPGMDGHTVVRRLRAVRPGSPVRLVALTGLGTPGDRQRSLEAGFDMHLVKPLSLAELEGVLALPPSDRQQVPAALPCEAADASGTSAPRPG